MIIFNIYNIKPLRCIKNKSSIDAKLQQTKAYAQVFINSFFNAKASEQKGLALHIDCAQCNIC
ncbi:hypothetical protein KCTC32420_02506 [Aequorivita nionensis]